MKIFTLSCVLLLSFSLQAKLLDKILAIVDGNIITLSQINRIQTNLNSRRTISPLIYGKKKYSKRDIAEFLIQRVLIRDKLSDVGYIISDEQVELQIKETEKNLGVNRDYLLDFLSNNNITFDEYFEVIRETLEFNVFHGRVIRPLISITEQQIKNRFYKDNINNKTLSFRYTLADFSMPAKAMTKNKIKKFKKVMQRFQNDGILNEAFKRVSSNLIEGVTEDGLTNELKALLKKTDEGGFTKPIKMRGEYHVFYVKKKDLVESEKFTKTKNLLRAKIFEEQSNRMIALWFKRAKNKHYIRYFF